MNNIVLEQQNEKYSVSLTIGFWSEFLKSISAEISRYSLISRVSQRNLIFKMGKFGLIRRYNGPQDQLKCDIHRGVARIYHLWGASN